ncbi:PDC sensor domain-containing protein, partial [Bacillus sp. SIMBA_069]
IFSEIVTSNPTISELQVATNDGRFVTFPGSPLDNEYDPRKTDWYKGAFDKQTTYVSDVFQFSQTEFPKIAISIALRNEDD